jgi:hypothetical protein
MMEDDLERPGERDDPILSIGVALLASRWSMVDADMQ